MQINIIYHVGAVCSRFQIDRIYSGFIEFVLKWKSQLKSFHLVLKRVRHITMLQFCRFNHGHKRDYQISNSIWQKQLCRHSTMGLPSSLFFKHFRTWLFQVKNKMRSARIFTFSLQFDMNLAPQRIVFFVISHFWAVISSERSGIA